MRPRLSRRPVGGQASDRLSRVVKEVDYKLKTEVQTRVSVGTHRFVFVLYPFFFCHLKYIPGMLFFSFSFFLATVRCGPIL